MSDNKLAGKIAIVTGAGRGLGRAIALAYGKAGASVAVADCREKDVGETLGMLKEIGAVAHSTLVDVSDWNSVQVCVNEVVDKLGGVHILVNNAGVQGPIGPLADNSIDQWISTINVNLIGVFYFCKAVLPFMKRQGYGKIINLSGGGATAARPNYSAYAVSKAGVVRLTETLAEEVKDSGIQVNAIAPGAMNTAMLFETIEAGDAAGKQAYEEAQRQLQTGGTPLEIPTLLAVFLASDESDGLTGRLISAPHDDWQNWKVEDITDLMSKPWLTLRRIDPHTLKQFS